MRFAGMDARSADATREAAPAAPRVPWSGGVMTVIMPQRLQADCPPDSERGGLRFEARQHTVECQLRVRRAFEQATRDRVAARRCGESLRECLELYHHGPPRRPSPFAEFASWQDFKAQVDERELGQYGMHIQLVEE